MVKTFLRASALIACLLPGVAPAQKQQINIFTFEDSSCGAWSKSAGNKLVRAQYLFWVQGFVSGHNFASPARQVRTGALPGSEVLYKYIDAYCKENPSLSFVGAAIALVEELREPIAPAKAPPAKTRPPATK